MDTERDRGGGENERETERGRQRDGGSVTAARCRRGRMHTHAFDCIPSGERAETSSLPLTCTPELSVCGCDSSGVQVYRFRRMLCCYLHGRRPLSLGHFSDFLTMSCCAPSNFVSGLRLRTGHTSWLDLIQVIGPHLRFGWSRIQSLASPALSPSERGRLKTRRQFNTRTDKVQSPPCSFPSLSFQSQDFCGIATKTNRLQFPAGNNCTNVPGLPLPDEVIEDRFIGTNDNRRLHLANAAAQRSVATTANRHFVHFLQHQDSCRVDQ